MIYVLDICANVRSQMPMMTSDKTKFSDDGGLESRAYCRQYFVYAHSNLFDAIFDLIRAGCFNANSVRTFSELVTPLCPVTV
jgi:hypothetical protein